MVDHAQALKLPSTISRDRPNLRPRSNSHFHRTFFSLLEFVKILSAHTRVRHHEVLIAFWREWPASTFFPAKSKLLSILLLPPNRESERVTEFGPGGRKMKSYFTHMLSAWHLNLEEMGWSTYFDPSEKFFVFQTGAICCALPFCFGSKLVFVCGKTALESQPTYVFSISFELFCRELFGNETRRKYKIVRKNIACLASKVEGFYTLFFLVAFSRKFTGNQTNKNHNGKTISSSQEKELSISTFLKIREIKFCGIEFWKRLSSLQSTWGYPRLLRRKKNAHSEKRKWRKGGKKKKRKWVKVSIESRSWILWITNGAQNMIEIDIGAVTTKWKENEARERNTESRQSAMVWESSGFSKFVGFLSLSS